MEKSGSSRPSRPKATSSTRDEADGGGPSLLPNQNRGPHYAKRTALGIGTNGGEQRMGHLSCLQRSSRAKDGTPIHLRMDGPGFDTMDVPGGGKLPKLQFTIFVPSAQFFRKLRVNQASTKFTTKFGSTATGSDYPVRLPWASSLLV